MWPSCRVFKSAPKNCIQAWVLKLPKMGWLPEPLLQQSYRVAQCPLWWELLMYADGQNVT